MTLPGSESPSRAPHPSNRGGSPAGRGTVRHWLTGRGVRLGVRHPSCRHLTPRLARATPPRHRCLTSVRHLPRRRPARPAPDRQRTTPVSDLSQTPPTPRPAERTPRRVTIAVRCRAHSIEGGIGSLGAWRERVAAGSERSGEELTTISGLAFEPLATPETVDLDHDRDLGYPGSFPFTRGVYPSMYRGRLWTMRQFAGFGTAAETNERFRYLLDHGQTGLSTAFDMPTLMGYDADHPRAEGEVGREGVAVSSLDDMRELFAGIPLARGVDVDDDQRAGGDPARALRRGGRGAGRPARPAPRDRSRRTSSRSTSRRRSTSSRPGRRCGS